MAKVRKEMRSTASDTAFDAHVATSGAGMSAVAMTGFAKVVGTQKVEDVITVRLSLESCTKYGSFGSKATFSHLDSWYRYCHCRPYSRGNDFSALKVQLPISGDLVPESTEEPHALSITDHSGESAGLPAHHWLNIFVWRR